MPDIDSLPQSAEADFLLGSKNGYSVAVPTGEWLGRAQAQAPVSGAGVATLQTIKAAIAFGVGEAFPLRRPLLDAVTLPLNGTVYNNDIYISGGNVWCSVYGGTTGAVGPVAGANPSDLVAAGAGSALFQLLGAKRPTLTNDIDIPSAVVQIRPSGFTGMRFIDPKTALNSYAYGGTTGPVARAGVALPARWINSSTWYGITAGVPAQLLGFDQVRSRRIGFRTRSKRVAIDGIGNYAPYQYFVEVNGKPLQDYGCVNSLGLLTGGPSTLLITFPSSAPREIWIGIPYDAEFGGVYVENAESISKPSVGPVRLLTEGDSLTEGQLARIWRGDWPSQVCDRLGIKDVFNISIGGTGFVSVGANNNPMTNAGRIQATISAKPDIILVGGAHNDGGYTSAERLAAFATWFNPIRAALPQAVIVFFGSTQLRGENWSPTYTAVDADISSFVAAKRAAGDRLVDFVPVVVDGEPWVLNGAVAPFFWTNGDAHPQQIGIDYLAQRYTDALCAWVTARV